MRDKPSPTPTAFETADRRASIVMVSGGATTVLALVGVYALGRSGENIMGWYGNYVIPVGALLVGAVASSGYGVAAWRTGLKLERPMFWAIAAQLAASYFVAQYVEFRQGGAAAAGVSFWAWFDVVTRAFAWRERNGGSGEAFGVFGYAMRALELAGFVGGGFLAPAIMASKPYCEPCRAYHRTRELALLPAGPPQKLFGDHPLDQLVAAKDEAVAGVRAILGAVRGGDRPRLVRELDARRATEGRVTTHKRTARVQLWLTRCPRCDAGELSATMLEGPADRAQATRLGAEALDGDRMRALFD